MNPAKVRVAVIGLGVAGGATAVALAREGAQVTVFEQAANPGPVGAGFLLQPGGCAALSNLGLFEPVLERAWPISRFVAYKAPGEILTTLRMSAHGVARGVLFEILRENALKSGARITAGARITDFIETSKEVTLRSDDGADRGSFDLVIAADGARSASREKLNPGAKLFTGTHGALWLAGSCAGLPHTLTQHARGVNILSGLLPTGEDRATFFWGIKADELDALKSAGWPAFIERVVRVFPEAESVLRDAGGFDRTSFATYGHTRIRILNTRRIALIGDAAHPMSPHLGQGANLALLDALALARAFRIHGDSPAIFPDLRRERRRQNGFYSLLSRALSPTFQSDRETLGCLRDFALPLMTAIPPLRRLMEKTLAGCVAKAVRDQPEFTSAGCLPRRGGDR